MLILFVHICLQYFHFTFTGEITVQLFHAPPHDIQTPAESIRDETVLIVMNLGVHPKKTLSR